MNNNRVLFDFLFAIIFTMKLKGFTLIELLVVVAIIGILATVVLASLNSASAKARDARRLADMRTLQTIMEKYYIENGSYFHQSSPHMTSSNDFASRTWAQLGTAIGETLPADPVNEAGGSAESGYLTYTYIASGAATYCAGQGYLITFNLEATDCPAPDATLCGASHAAGNICAVGNKY